jgi:hypothetical protein
MDAEAYMLSHGWKQVPYPRPQLLVFGGVLDDDGQEIILTLPSSEHMRDYRVGVVQLISALSVYEDRLAVHILNEMLQMGMRNETPTRPDEFFIRE